MRLKIHAAPDMRVDDYNARLYDPSLGRFLSVDPLIAHPESTQGINPYSYVENNPLNKTDPTGEARCPPMCGFSWDMMSTTQMQTPAEQAQQYNTASVTLMYSNGTTVQTTLGKISGMTRKQLDALGNKAKNSTGPTNVNDATTIDGKDPSSAGTDPPSKSGDSPKGDKPKATYADKVLYGEARNYAYTKDGSAPKGLADAKASLGAACSRNGASAACKVKDGSDSTGENKIAWNNILHARGGKDRSGGGNGVCIGQTKCKFRHGAWTYKNGEKVWVERKKPLPWTGQVTISGAENGSITFYFYKFKYKGWLTKDDYLYGPKGHP